MSAPQLAAIRAFLLDMDGTLVVDARLLPGALELTELLRRSGRRPVTAWMAAMNDPVSGMRPSVVMQVRSACVAK